MESLLKNLREQVTCSICLDTFTDPKTITCLHTFCCECLKKHALISQRNGKFRCPECQAEVGLPEANRFDKLPTSFHHKRLLSLLAVRQSGDGNEISCGVCKKKRAEISYCFECAKFMCRDCVNAHQLFPNLTEGHKVTPVKQFQAEDYEALMKTQSFCSQQYHERVAVRFFCLSCKQCVCQICIATDHKSHDVELLDKVADGEKAKILTRAEMLKEKTKTYRDAILKLEETKLDLQTNITNVKRDVSQIAERMIAKIRESERDIITYIEKMRLSRSQMLNSAKAKVQSLLKQIDQAVQFAEHLVQRSSSSDIMQSKAKLEQRYQELENTPLPELPVNCYVKHYPNYDPEKLNVGFVATNKPVIKVKGLNKDFQAGKESEFEINIGIHEEQTYGGKYQFHIDVLVEPAYKVRCLRTYKMEGGASMLKFTPKVPGTFNITAKLNGNVFATSPYTVKVKQRLIQVVGELEVKGENLESPWGIAVNSKGLIAVSDDLKHCILIISNDGNCIRKIGCHGNNAGQFDGPSGVTYLNDDNILVADESNHRIQQFNVQTGNFVKCFGKNGKNHGEFKNPVSICVDDKGHVIVADFNNHRVQVLSQNGEPLFMFGHSGPEKLNHPKGCIFHENTFIVSELGGHCLKVYDNSGRFLYKIGDPGKGDGQFSNLGGMCIEKWGDHHNLLVCDGWNCRVCQFTVEGCFTGKTVDKLQCPRGIAATPDGFILVLDNSVASKLFMLK